MSVWYDETATRLEDAGHDRFSASWYAAMRDAYFADFPDADERSKDNMRQMAEDAAAKECDRGVLLAGPRTRWGRANLEGQAA